jgi:hypothetical protein
VTHQIILGAFEGSLKLKTGKTPVIQLQISKLMSRELLRNWILTLMVNFGTKCGSKVSSHL